jgi:hypothetical protein
MQLSLADGHHVVEVDVDATAACYARIAGPFPEACECMYCANWVAARSSVVSEEVAQFLAQLGIPRTGEIEVYHTSGIHKANFYGGWYNFVGRHVSGDLARTWQVGGIDFCVGTGNHAVVDAFAGHGVTELHFSCEVDDFLTADEYEALTLRLSRRLDAPAS